ncbi:MAG: hypothetical protein V2B19_09100 [Pseudomonadota bacterium]
MSEFNGGNTDALRQADEKGKERINMQALKKVISVKNRKIILDLPDDFQSDQVEIIVLPYIEEEREYLCESNADWQKDFLSISQWEEEDDDIARVTSWTIETF